MWISRTHKQFEWVVDVLRELEEADADSLVETHIFIRALKHQFDLQTTMLVRCD